MLKLRTEELASPKLHDSADSGAKEKPHTKQRV